MGINKNALLRFRTIDQVIRDKKYAKMDTIRKAVANKMEPGYTHIDKVYPTRTFYQDIKDMIGDSDQGRKLGFFAPIDVNERKEYFYADPQYIFTQIPFTSFDGLVINESLTLLNQLKDIPLIHELTKRLNLLMDYVHQNSTTSIPLNYSKVEMQKSPLKGMEYFIPLLECITRQQRVEINYQSYFKDKPRKTIIEPYLLKEYKNRWYLLAVAKGKPDFTTYALDRIKGLESLDELFTPKEGFSANEYFNYSYGITAVSDGVPQKIRLRFDELLMKYMKDLPLHPSQKIIKETKNSIEVELEVYITIELIKDIRSFGNRVQVIKPKNLLNEYEDW